ncbi:hypothetical protein BJ508DRAFT_366419 [Ascobolus immersus RN42]|uniref:Uncharacterized protein n=1 Tax=Ascobolus immersus RN42 TaxID=1160509 RepID=A0A3N4HJQ4_ASCIM|nr:hypothetical protein BJ508DRAFT_366419 [Ascobolus immersus RN42]
MPSRFTFTGSNKNNGSARQRRSQLKDSGASQARSQAQATRSQANHTQARRSANPSARNVNIQNLPVEISLLTLGMVNGMAIRAVDDTTSSHSARKRRSRRANRNTGESNRNHNRRHGRRSSHRLEIEQEMEDLQAEYDDLDSAPASKASDQTISFISHSVYDKEIEQHARFHEYQMSMGEMEKFECLRRQMGRADGVHFNAKNDMERDLAFEGYFGSFDGLLTLFRDLTHLSSKAKFCCEEWEEETPDKYLGSLDRIMAVMTSMVDLSTGTEYSCEEWEEETPDKYLGSLDGLITVMTSMADMSTKTEYSYEDEADAIHYDFDGGFDSNFVELMQGLAGLSSGSN